MIHPFATLAAAFERHEVRYLLIGVSAANLYAPSGQAIFTTEDIDVFLPPDPDNLLRTWSACEDADLELWLANEPLEQPRDRHLALQVVDHGALTHATGADDLMIDLSLVMTGFTFDAVWPHRRMFRIDGVGVPVARLRHIIESKHATGRDKDRLFLATHRDALEQLLRRSDRDTP